MRVVALRRHPFLSKDDPLCDVVYGTDKKSLNKLMSESDYIVCSAPSTTETRGMVNAEAFASVKKNAVFINLGRGPVVDEKALIASLKSGQLKGAALVSARMIESIVAGMNLAFSTIYSSDLCFCFDCYCRMCLSKNLSQNRTKCGICLIFSLVPTIWTRRRRLCMRRQNSSSMKTSHAFCVTRSS